MREIAIQHDAYVLHMSSPKKVTSFQKVVFLVRPYVSTGRAIAVTTASASASASASALPSASALLKMLKFLVKVFKNLYLLNPWMDLVNTFPDVRYWSEILYCTITAYIGDLEVKVTDFEILS